MFSFDIKIKSFGKQHAVCNMDGTFTKCTRCIQSINVESRLILISVKSGVTYYAEFFFGFKSFFQMFLTLRFQYCLYLVLFVGCQCLTLKLSFRFTLEKGYKI